MLSIVGFILTVSILVFVHEFGHYLAAIIGKVKIEEFAIGFGKELIGFTDKKGVRWKICLIPFGGYVKIYGQERNLGKVGIINEKVAFFAKSCFTRFMIVAAGPMINYLLAIVILTGFHFFLGKIEIPAVIGEVVVASPAEQAGLIENDKIIKVNNEPINDFIDLQNKILLNQDKTLDLFIQRNNEEFIVKVTPRKILYESEKSKKKVQKVQIGIIAKNEPIKTNLNLFQSTYEATNTTINFTILTLKALGQIVLGQRSLAEIGGPITIAKESGNSLSQGSSSYLLFIAMLSINLGLINLLPIPVLDGGHLIFIVYEAITRKPLSDNIKNGLLRFGIFIIVFLMITSIFNDIKNLIF